MSFFSKAAAVVASFGAGVALSDKVKGFVSPTQQAFNKIKFGDVSGSASVAGFKPISKFTNNDFTNSPSSLISSMKSSLEQEGFSVKAFPTDVGQYYIKLTFSSYKRDVPLIAVKADPKLTVIFPLPANLTEPFNVNYNDAKLGPILGAATETLSRVASGKTSMSDAAGALGGQIKESGAVLGRAAVGSMKSGETLLANVDKATGFVPNPHLAAIFQDIGLREHNFTFKFSPKNKQEADELSSIIKAIRRRMLPGTGESSESSTGPVFTFPDTVEISFSEKANLYPIKRCVLHTMNVNYAPNGTPAFFKTGDPTDIEISMSFKEVEVVTRADYKD